MEPHDDQEHSRPLGSLTEAELRERLREAIATAERARGTRPADPRKATLQDFLAREKLLLAREKLLAAVHEAGHVTVAVAIHSQFCGAYIWHEPTADPELKEWRGQARLVPRSSPVSIAGVAAECLVESEIEGCGELAGYDIADWIESGDIELSATDAEGLQGETIEEDADLAIAAIRSHRWLFDWVVSELLTEGEVTDGMVRDFFRKQSNAKSEGNEGKQRTQGRQGNATSDHHQAPERPGQADID